jgi:arginine decarboxylase
LSCDSDGKIDRFIASGDAANSHGSKDKQVLELHPYRGESYDLAAFLVGAYQEILGDLHNLFGDTHAVHVKLDDEGTPTIEEVVEGDTVDEVLRYVQFNPDWLKRHFRQVIERALKHRRITLDESRFLADFYERGLAGYTYLT